VHFAVKVDFPPSSQNQICCKRALIYYGHNSGPFIFFRPKPSTSLNSHFSPSSQLSTNPQHNTVSRTGLTLTFTVYNTKENLFLKSSASLIIG